MGDVEESLAQEGESGIRLVVVLEAGVANERADPHGLVGDGHRVEPGHAVDVDEVRGRGQAHVEDRDEALAAREDLAVVADLSEDVDGRLEGFGCVVAERWGLHVFDPAFC